jgi:hypothetical protein
VQPVNSDAHLLVRLLQVPLDVPHPDVSGLVTTDDFGLEVQHQDTACRVSITVCTDCRAVHSLLEYSVLLFVAPPSVTKASQCSAVHISALQCSAYVPHLGLFTHWPQGGLLLCRAGRVNVGDLALPRTLHHLHSCNQHCPVLSCTDALPGLVLPCTALRALHTVKPHPSGQTSTCSSSSGRSAARSTSWCSGQSVAVRQGLKTQGRSSHLGLESGLPVLAGRLLGAGAQVEVHGAQDTQDMHHPPAGWTGSN